MVFKAPSIPNPSAILFCILNSRKRRGTFALKWSRQSQQGDVRGHSLGPFGTSCRWSLVGRSCPRPAAGASRHEELSLPCQGFAPLGQEGPSPCNCLRPSLAPRDMAGRGEGCPHRGAEPSTASARSTHCPLPRGRLGCKKRKRLGFLP